MKSTIGQIEYYFPNYSENLSEMKKDNPNWDIEAIVKKTGIKKRFISKESILDMSVKAANKLFLKNNYKKENLDFLVLVTQSPDFPLPTTACVIQDKLGLKKECLSFDINQGCSGYIYGLAICSSLIQSGLAKSGILICSEKYSKYISKENRTCRTIFSDAASATIINSTKNNILGPFDFGTDGSGYNNLIVPNKEIASQDSKYKEGEIYMSGSDVFLFTMSKIPKSINNLLNKAEKKIKDIDFFIFHQASKLVIDNLQKRLKIPHNKIYNNYSEIGNTISSSIPIALDQAIKKKLIKKNDTVMFIGFGVGYSWGACLYKHC